METIKNNPVLLGFAAVMFIVVLVAMVFGLTEGELLAAVGIVSGLVALVVRSQVSPVHRDD